MIHGTQKLDILLATWEGGGNLPPVIGAARRLIARGHRVRIMSDVVGKADAHTVGAEFRPWCRAPSRSDRLPASDLVRDWEAETDLGGFVALRDGVMCGPALDYALDLADELQRRPADVVVSNEMLFGVMVACEAMKTPLVLLCPNISLFPLPGVPPVGAGLRPASSKEERAEHERIGLEFGSVLDEGLPRVNEARSFLGLPLIDRLEEQARAAKRILLATSPAFDFPPDFLPPPVRYVGPLLEEPSWAKGVPAYADDHSQPLVLIAFSTTFQDQVATLRNVARALAQMPVTGLITLGPALAGTTLDIPPNVTAIERASHDALMSRASLVVTHAGHGTVMRALTHGVPLLCMPMGRDQNDNAIRVSESGAGLTLDRHAPPEAIRHALQRLIDEDRFAKAAASLARKLADRRGLADLVIEIEETANPGNTLRARPGLATLAT